MSNSQEFLKNAGPKGEAKKGNKVKKIPFTPPVLHKYGEVGKVSGAGPNQGPGDFFTQAS